MPENIDDLMQIFKAEPTKLTKQELIELGKWIGGLKLTMDMKEATMISKIQTIMVDTVEVVPEVVIKDAPPAPKTEIAHTVLGRRVLEADKVYKLTRSQRSALKAKGASMVTVPKEMKGSELMKFRNWRVLGL
tara:strand:+ start:1865 stop:2263 length:399 start_codon:yes stop_codon:yes gene_type:complete